jgi:hypothetical protein
MRWLLLFDTALRLLTIDRLLRLLLLTILVLVILLPLLSGHTKLPPSLEAEAIGAFLSSLFSYWVSVFRQLKG